MSRWRQRPCGLSPALLTELDGSGFEFSAEHAKAGNAVTSQALVTFIEIASRGTPLQ